MRKLTVLRGTVEVPGDKSISHRSVIFSAIGNGKVSIRNFLMAEDCVATLQILKTMWVDVQLNRRDVIVIGVGLHGLKQPETILDVGNSGTGIRLLAGLLAGQSFPSRITGDVSIQKRPMDRIIKPLRQMNASVEADRDDRYCPLTITPGELKGMVYQMQVASAQVKSCMLLAGLYADGPTIIQEKEKSRDHTERMMQYLGFDLSVSGNVVTLGKQHQPKALDLYVPGDISSALFLIVAVLIIPDSEVTLLNIGLNESRIGALDVLKEMGADLSIENRQLLCGEPVGDIRVRSSQLKGVEIAGKQIPSLIDEIPILSIAACFAEGKTVIRDAKELRVKESDRISVLVSELSKMNAQVTELVDGLLIEGKCELRASKELCSFHDHRIAMSLAIADMAIGGESRIDDLDCINTSFPDFFELFSRLAEPRERSFETGKQQ